VKNRACRARAVGDDCAGATRSPRSDEDIPDGAASRMKLKRTMFSQSAIDTAPDQQASMPVSRRARRHATPVPRSEWPCSRSRYKLQVSRRDPKISASSYDVCSAPEPDVTVGDTEPHTTTKSSGVHVRGHDEGDSQ